MSYLNNREKQQLDSKQISFLDADSLLIIQESENSNSFQSKLEGELAYTHNADDFYIRNKLSSTLIWTQQNNHIISTNHEIHEKYNLPQQLLRNDFRIVVPQKKGRLEATSLTQFAILSHDAVFAIRNVSELYPYTQHYKYNNINASNQISYTFQLNNYQIKNNLGFPIDFPFRRP